MTTKMIDSAEALLSTSLSLNPQQRSALLQDFKHRWKGMTDPLYWMQHCTKTLDEQWQKKEGAEQKPFKPFPQKPYLIDLHQAWKNEPMLFIEKSRTMLGTWFCAAEILHEMMTQTATRWLIIAQDELRSLKALDYCWTLWEQQDESFKTLWSLDRPREKQSYNVLELANHSSATALPGKDAGNKIRSEHPTGILFDEAAYIDDFHAAMNSAISTRAKRIVALTSANPGGFRDVTRSAMPIEWPYDHAI